MTCNCNTTQPHTPYYVSHYNKCCEPAQCGCSQKLSTACIYYDSSSLPIIGVRSADKLEDILKRIEHKFDELDNILDDIGLRLDSLEEIYTRT